LTFSRSFNRRKNFGCYGILGTKIRFVWGIVIWLLLEVVSTSNKDKEYSDILRGIARALWGSIKSLHFLT
jgi:hypothetical protein